MDPAAGIEPAGKATSYIDDALRGAKKSSREDALGFQLG